MLGPYALGQTRSATGHGRSAADAGSARVGHNATERQRQPNPPPGAKRAPTSSDEGARGGEA